MPELQPRLFTDLPPTREETPAHQLSYPDFAESSNTMWHGRRARATVSPHPPFTGREGWDPTGSDPVHVGTFEAATDRLTSMGADVSGESPRETLERVAHRPVDEALGQVQMLPFRIREGSMWNTPDMPVSDAYANLATEEDDDFYETEYIEEVLSSGLIEGPVSDTEIMNEYRPPTIDETGGLYYRNTHEDKGSVSAVVPEAGDLEHWPTEVSRHSTNPWDRRMAQFMRGRGY